MHLKNWLIAALFFVSPALYAHTGNVVDHSLINGLLHPLTGVDHLLVLMAVGLCAAKQGGKALWVFPALFMLLMSTGILLKTLAIAMPFNESLISLSVIVFGVLLAINHKPLSNLLFVGASLFAIFHGYAHAAEVPDGANTAWYFSSLLLMSLMICLAGCTLGLGAGKRVNYMFSIACLSSGCYYLATI
ncbi:MAG: HupE/UreJ family protein [Methylococcaceae bacterium]